MANKSHSDSDSNSDSDLVFCNSNKELCEVGWLVRYTYDYKDFTYQVKVNIHYIGWNSNGYQMECI